MAFLVLLAVAAAHSHHHHHGHLRSQAHALAVANTTGHEEPHEDPLAAHEGVQGKITYHGYDQDWHTEYKGDIHSPDGKDKQKEAFMPGYLHEEYTKNGPSNW